MSEESKTVPPDDPLCDPGQTDLKSLTDGRLPGDYKSRYPFLWAWFQINLELAYLLILLSGGMYFLFLLMKLFILGAPSTFFPEAFGEYPKNKLLLTWICVALGGLCGGCTTALKWLYHTVAKQHWHHDRLIWRLVVPILAAVLSVFIGLMVHSGLVPDGKLVDKNTLLSNPTVAAGFGFFVGLFSDHALASLQNLARRIFGTTKDGSV